MITSVDEKMIHKYLKESIVDPKMLKIARDNKGPIEGVYKTLLFLMADIYELPDAQIVSQLKKIVPDVDSAKTIQLIKKIRKAVEIFEGKTADTEE